MPCQHLLLNISHLYVIVYIKQINEVRNKLQNDTGYCFTLIIVGWRCMSVY